MRWRVHCWDFHLRFMNVFLRFFFSIPKKTTTMKWRKELNTKTWRVLMFYWYFITFSFVGGGFSWLRWWWCWWWWDLGLCLLKLVLLIFIFMFCLLARLLAVHTTTTRHINSYNNNKYTITWGTFFRFFLFTRLITKGKGGRLCVISGIVVFIACLPATLWEAIANAIINVPSEKKQTNTQTNLNMILFKMRRAPKLVRPIRTGPQ